MNKIFRENITKNLLILLALVPSYFSLEQSLSNPDLYLDKVLVGNMLLAVSIVAVIACFGNFAFTYEDMKQKIVSQRLLAHITSGLLIYLIGLSLEMTSILTSFLVEGFALFHVGLVILYLASVLYDFWDLSRVDV